MNFTTKKLEITLEGISLKESQLIKNALLQYNRFDLVENYERPTVSAIIETIDQAVDQVLSNKYANWVFGVTDAEVLVHS